VVGVATGVSMLSKCLSVEWGEFGIRSNTVSPAMVRTPLSETVYKDSDVVARREAIVPLRRTGSTQDIANTVAFLSSDRASYISGQEIIVDGGLVNALSGLIPRPGYERTAIGP